MLKLPTSAVLAVSVAANSYASNSSQFILRYTSGQPSTTAVSDDQQKKDIFATVVAGVGLLFSEFLPMRGDWSIDSWVITKGQLPDGITFDSQTREFKGVS